VVQDSLSVDDDLLSTIQPDSPRDYGNGYDYGVDEGRYPPSEGHHRHFGSGAEDVAREVEESILGHSNPLALTGPGLANRRQSTKRYAPGAASDGSSDLEVPSSSRLANKKRKLDKDDDIIDNLGHSFVGRNLKLGEGRGKQIQREVSLDSVPVSQKASPRKKLGPRKKLDIFPPETLDSLGLGASTSVSADATPAASRLSSPALTASSVVFGLEEVIPPLRKAKRVDDNAMLKRVKALEEAQRKVWTNIAKRDVARVGVEIFYRTQWPHSKVVRFINIMPWVIKRGKHNWSVLPSLPLLKLGGHSLELQRPTKTCKRKESG
jgi:DNA helicase INO80